MHQQKTLQRFLDAQQTTYNKAFAEIQTGKKQTHWMWYIFPQVHGLGFSETSKFYSIKNKNEANEYLHNPVLGTRLINICTELLRLQHNNATKIFGSPDDVKLFSSMTLFASLPGTNAVFNLVLEKFFNGEMDNKTLLLLEEES